MNWLDVAILTVLAYFAYTGYRHGLLVGLLELIGIVVSVGVPFLLYIPAGRLLIRLGVSEVYSGALAFLIIWFLTLNLYFFVARRLYRRVPRDIRLSAVNSILGVFPGLVRGVIVIAILLAVLAALPNPLVTQDVIDGSVLAPPLVNASSELTAYAADIFGGAIRTALGFITVQPESEGSIQLPYRVERPSIEPEIEERMLDLVNRDRTQRGLRPLVMDETIRRVARRHSTDMFRRGYFSHNTPDGVTPFQRMSRGGVYYLAAGENLALAPNLQIAHQGLMKSPGHRANILRSGFRRVGIGVAKGGIHGLMFTQDFAN